MLCRNLHVWGGYAPYTIEGVRSLHARALARASACLSLRKSPGCKFSFITYHMNGIKERPKTKGRFHA